MPTLALPRPLPAALLLALATLAAAPARAQTATEALGGQWNTICATAAGGTLLFVRCDETLSSPDPLANMIAATGQRLEEIPGQVRIASRDIANLPGSTVIDLGGGRTAVFTDDPFGGLSLGIEDESLGNGWSLFASADLGRVTRDRSRNEAAFDADTWSLTVGADWRPNADWVVGAALSHVRETLDYAGSAGRVETDFTGALLIASRSFGNSWSADAYAGWVNGGYDLRREISYEFALPSGLARVQGMAMAAPDARRRLAGVGVGRYWSRNGWDFDLGTGLDWTSTGIDGYTEQGGVGLNLIVPGRDTQTRRGRIDFGIGRTVSANWGVWQPSLRLGWRHEFSGGRRQVTVRLAQDPLQYPITFDTEDADNGWAELAIGSAFTLAGGHSGFLQYQQRLGHDFLQERILALGWRIELP